MAGFAPLIAWARKVRAMKLNIGTIRVNLTLETKIRSGWFRSEVIMTGLTERIQLVAPILAKQLFEWDGISSKMPCIYAVPLPIGRDLWGTTTTRENRAQVIKDFPRPDVFAADTAVG